MNQSTIFKNSMIRSRLDVPCLHNGVKMKMSCFQLIVMAPCFALAIEQILGWRFFGEKLNDC